MATAAENGAFYQSGLRVGGPYEIRISASAYRDRKLDAVTLKPGAQPPLAVALITVDVEEVVVTASPLVSERDLNNGVGSAYSADDIANAPSITRDVIRTLLRDPLAQSGGEGNLSVGGVTTRASTASPSTARCSRTTSVSAPAPTRPAARPSTSMPWSPPPSLRPTIPSPPPASPAVS